MAPIRGSRVLCEGNLGVQKEEGLASRYFLLTETLFEYFADRDALSSQQVATGAIDLSSIEAVEHIPEGFKLCMEDGQRLPLSMLVEGDTEMWMQAFQSLGVEVRGENDVSTKKLYEGEVQYIEDGDQRRRQATAYEDRIEFRGSSVSSWKEVTLKHVLGVKVDDSTVTISLGRRDVAFEAAGDESQAWGQVLNSAVSQIARRRSSIRTSRRGSASVPAAPEARASQRSSRRSASPPPEEEPRADAEEVLHEGELTLTRGSSKAQYHFVLYQDRLQYYGSPEALQQGRPEGVFVLEEIEDLEVEDSRFIVHMASGGEPHVLEQTSPSAMQGWIDAFAQILETDECIGVAARCVHEGPLDLVAGPNDLERMHVVLHGDKINFFEGKEDSDRGCVPLDSIMTADVRSVTVKDDAVLIGLDDKELRLQLPEGEDIDAWVDGLKGVMDPDGHDGGPTEITQGSWPWSATSTPSTAATTSASVQQQCRRLPDSPLAREMGDPRVAAWLNSMNQEAFYYHGVLWLQRDRRLVPRFCVLFGDRIDWWASPLQAASQTSSHMQPEGRIVLSEVRGLSVIGTGFVLNYRGRKMGIHVGDLVELQAWSQALLSVLEPGAARAQSPPRSPTGSRLPSSPSAFSQGRQSRQSPRGGEASPGAAASRAWVPRVATLPSPAAARSRLAESVVGGGSPAGSTARMGQQGGYPDGKRSLQRHVGVAQCSSATGRAALARRQMGRPDPSDPAGVAAAAAFSNARKECSSGKDRVTSPRQPLDREHFVTKQGLSNRVAGKVNTRVENAKEIMQAAQSRNDKVSDKVSYPCMVSPRSPQVADKITGACNPGAVGVGLRSPRAGNVAPKPNEADRVSVRSLRCGAPGTAGLAGKITGGPERSH